MPKPGPDEKPSPHPWRLCPYGKHWVKAHERNISVSKEHPEGKTEVEGHCRKNPSGHEILLSDEIEEISRRHLPKLQASPTNFDLGYPNGNKFDDLIGLWTQFWNEIYRPLTPLDPDIVKALVASESGFRVNIATKNKKRIGNAQGLIQITEQTRKILGDQKGELKDYLVALSKEEIFDPNFNLVAGIRWLFYKRDFLSRRLKRLVSWEEAAIEYKGLTAQIGKNEKANTAKATFEKELKALRESKK